MTKYTVTKMMKNYTNGVEESEVIALVADENALYFILKLAANLLSDRYSTIYEMPSEYDGGHDSVVILDMDSNNRLKKRTCLIVDEVPPESWVLFTKKSIAIREEVSKFIIAQMARTVGGEHIVRSVYYEILRKESESMHTRIKDEDEEYIIMMDKPIVDLGVLEHTIVARAKRIERDCIEVIQIIEEKSYKLVSLEVKQ